MSEGELTRGKPRATEPERRETGRPIDTATVAVAGIRQRLSPQPRSARCGARPPNAYDAQDCFRECGPSAKDCEGISCLGARKGASLRCCCCDGV